MGSNAPGALAELRKKVIDQKTAEFPDEPVEDAEIDAARIRLQNLGQLVTTLVIQVLQGQPIRMAADQDDPDLNSELSALRQNKPEQYHRLIDRYRQQKERLDTMLNLAIQASAEMDSK